MSSARPLRSHKLTVIILPPNAMLSTFNLAPTESGPTEVRVPVRTMDPPPSAILWTSGIVKLVRTPAIFTNAADCRGYPVFRRAHMSVVLLDIISYCQLRTVLFWLTCINDNVNL